MGSPPLGSSYHHSNYEKQNKKKLKPCEKYFKKAFKRNLKEAENFKRISKEPQKSIKRA